LDREKLVQEWESLKASEPVAQADDPSLPLGKYKPNFGKINKLPGLTMGAPYSAAIVWPTPQNENEQFPVLSFAHGTLVGSVYPESATAYKHVFEAVASFGFIIVAPDSCPAIECFSAYSKDQLAALKAVKDDPTLHPSLATADFNKTGIFGHSMGAMSTIVSDGKAADYNIKAAVSMHTCSDIGIHSASAQMPILFTTGSADKICGSGCTDLYYPGVKPSKALFNIKGASHFEPSNLGDASEKYAIAYWFACHIRGEQCDRVYGPSGKALCDQLPSNHSLTDCKVAGKAPPAPPPSPLSPISV
jgi:hypothetical protein